MGGETRPFLLMLKFVSIKKDTDRIMQNMESYLAVHGSTVLTEPVFDRLVNTLSDSFNTTPSTIALSCPHLKKEPFTRELIYKTIWRLSANSDRIVQGYPLLFYPRFSFTGLEEIRFESTQLKGDKYKTVIKVLTGHYAQGTFTCNFSKRGVGRILSRCGYTYRKYVAGILEDCLPGLFAQAHLINAEEDPRIFKDIIINDDINSFNRKNIIGFRSKLKACPYHKRGGCKKCPVFVNECLASYKGFNYD